MPCVYLLAIDPPYNGCSHYIGYSKHTHPAIRLAQHQAGRGGEFTKKAVAAKSKLSLIMHWSGRYADEVFERFIKDDRTRKEWCPHCGINTRPIPSLADRPNRSRADLIKEMAERKRQRVERDLRCTEVKLWF